MNIDNRLNIEYGVGLQFVDWLAEELQIIRLEEGISPDLIANMMCRVVNLALVARLNQYYPELCASGLRAPNTRNTISYRGFPLEHVVGYCFHPDFNLHFTFDGTADQLLGVGNGIQIFYAESFELAVQQMNNNLGINITQQIIGPNSYVDIN